MVVSVLLLVLAMPAAGQVRVSTVQEAVERWTPETHLYVLGDVGLGDEALAEMEAWLEGRHWTVLLVENAAGQEIQDTDGVFRSGEYAVEFGTGQGIARKPGFAGQVHPKTGEPDGAILSIVLAQRVLFYTGSEAQDSRGLGEEAFEGNLDGWAIAALRNGGDIVSAVKDTVTNVDARLAEAIGSHRGQAPSYLAGSRTRVSDAEDVQAADRRSFLSVLSVVLLGALATAAWSLNRRRHPVKTEAEALLASSQAAGRRQEALFSDLQWRAERLIERDFAGETAELARQVREDLASLAALGPSARVVVEQAAEHIRPGLYNLFFAGNYALGLALLRDEGLMEEVHERTVRAAGALDELETSLRELPLLVEKTHERIWQAGLQKDYLAEAGADGLFLVPTVFSELLPAATAALDSAQETADADPVGTWKGEASRAERMAADAWRLAGLCRGVRSAVMPALQSTEVWVEEGLRSLSSRAADLASQSAKEAARETVSEEIETLAADFAELPDLAGRLIETRSRIAATESRVESSRIEIATALGLAPDLLLRETSEKLRSAAQQVAETEARLRRGEVGSATEALESASRMAAEAEAFLATSRKTFEERDSAVTGRRAETERLAALLPEHEAVLAGIREAYAESALGTAADRLDEAGREIDAARAQLDFAAAGIRKGRLLAAASLLGQVRARQEQAGAHLAEIVEWRARLDRAREDNLHVLAELEARAGDMGPELTRDPGITQRTLAVFEEAAGRIRTVREWIDAGREDPLRAGQELLAARNELDRVETTLAPEDRRLYEEALRRRREEEEEDRRRAERRRRSTASSLSSSSSSSSSRSSGSSSSSGSRRSGSGKSRW